MGYLHCWYKANMGDGHGMVPQRLQSLGSSTGVQNNFSQQTITVSTHGGSGIIVSQLFVHFFLVSSPLALRIRRNNRKKRNISTYKMGTNNRRCAQLVNTPRGQGRVDNFAWEM